MGKIKFILKLFFIISIAVTIGLFVNHIKSVYIVIKKTGDNKYIDMSKFSLQEGKLKLCNEEVFRLQNKINDILSIQSSSKDVIQMLIAMNHINQNLGKLTDFSSDFIVIFRSLGKFREMDYKFKGFQSELYDKLYRLPDNQSMYILISDIERFVENGYSSEAISFYQKVMVLVNKQKKKIQKLKSKNKLTLADDSIENKLQNIRYNISIYEYETVSNILNNIKDERLLSQDSFIELSDDIRLIVDYINFNKNILENLDSVY